jgi:hypothetical protein
VSGQVCGERPAVGFLLVYGGFFNLDRGRIKGIIKIIKSFLQQRRFFAMVPCRVM